MRTADGMDDEHPINLSSVTPSELESLLTVLYHPYVLVTDYPDIGL